VQVYVLFLFMFPTPNSYGHFHQWVEESGEAVAAAPVTLTELTAR
jgi:hypothetical protein